MQAVMMTRMTFGVQRLERPATEIERRLIVSNDDTCVINRQNLTVELVETFLTVHGLRAGDQPRRIGHVSCPTRMYHGARIGQGLHQQSGAAGVIEVHVG